MMIAPPATVSAALVGALHASASMVAAQASVHGGLLEHAAALIASPLVAPILLCLGFFGLLAEIRTPTFGMAGVAGLLALGLFFGSHVLTGLASVGDIVIVGVGLVLLGVEVFVIPGFGVVGVVGISGVLTGIYLSLLGPGPSAVDLLRAALVLAATLLITALLAWSLLRSLPPAARPGAGGIFLPHLAGVGLGLEERQRLHAELLGRQGAAITDLRPVGTAEFAGERLDVVAESEWIAAGTPVHIVSTDGYRRVVRPTGEARTAPPA